MSTDSKKIPTWFWIVVALMMVWNLMGVASFFQHIMISDESLKALPIEEQELYGHYPFWTQIAFAVAVFGGTAGCVGLFLRAPWTKGVFVASFIAIVVQMFHSLFIAGAMDVYGPGAVVMPVMVVVMGGYLVWLAAYVERRGW